MARAGRQAGTLEPADMTSRCTGMPIRSRRRSLLAL